MNLSALWCSISNYLFLGLLGRKGFAIFSRLSELLLLGILLVGMLKDTLGEYVVKLLGNSNVSLLQLSETVHHQSVFEVLSHHGLKHAQVVARESAHAGIER